MQDLRLVGVHEDGRHLLLSGSGSQTFRLAIDEALRSAVNRPSARSGAVAEESAPTLSPRDIQARIRAGATAEQIAEESGMTLDRVLRYEGPVRAERDYIAEQAQRVIVGGPLPSLDGYRPQPEETTTLLDMVLHRLSAFGADRESLQWDAWRRADGDWDVVAAFSLTPGTTPSIGEEPPARWIYHPAGRTLTNANRWAQVLSELESLDGPLPARRLTAVSDKVFDFEAEQDPDQDGLQADELLDMLRSRRGHRLGTDEDADDALALLLTRGPVPAAHPRPGPQDTDEFGTPPFPGFGVDDADDGGLPRLHPGVSQATTEITLEAGTGDQDTPDGVAADQEATDQDSGANGKDDGDDDRDDAAGGPHAGSGSSDDGRSDDGRSDDDDSGVDNKPGRGRRGKDRKAIKPKRSSIPSWDDIVFGTKGDS